MDPWKNHRRNYMDARAAVFRSYPADGWGKDLQDHFTVIVALAQIDIAERAIASVATELNCKYHDGEDE